MDVNNSLTEEEVKRKLPEVESIEDDELREMTIKAFVDYCPDYFWESPASSSGKYHQEDHRGKHGLWLHTKRAFTVFEGLARSYEAQNRLSSYDVDCGRSAILLHDMFKYGWPPQAHTTSDHDMYCARYLDKHTDLPEEVISCIATHNGPSNWGAGPAPSTDLEDVHHMADMVASREENDNIAVKTPSEELISKFDNLNTL